MNYELHPLCTLFPRITGAEFDALVADIKANGLREPIIIHEGMILDGGNRYRACIEAGVEPAVMKFGGGNLVTYVLSANLHRRHLSPGQQAAIVSSAQDWGRAQGDGKPGNLARLDTRADRAAMSGASDGTQKMADKVAKASPELAKQVGRGEISLPKAVEQITGKRPGARPEPEPAPTAPEDDYTETDELRDQVAGLQDMLAVRGAPEEERETTEKLVAGMREQIKTLTATLEAVSASRDGLMRTNAQLMKQVAMQRKEIDKLRSMGAVA